MEWMQIAPYIFGFMALAIAGWIGKSLGDLGASAKSMEESIGKLNLNVAVIVEKVANHEKRIERLEERDE